MSVWLLNQGCQNGAFGKRSFCWGDTRHFRHFRRFPGSEEQSPLFLWTECNIRIFANFRQNHLFSAGDKTTVFQNDRFDNPDLSAGFGVLSAGFPRMRRTKMKRNRKKNKRSKLLGEALRTVPQIMLTHKPVSEMSDGPTTMGHT